MVQHQECHPPGSGKADTGDQKLYGGSSAGCTERLHPGGDGINTVWISEVPVCKETGVEAADQKRTDLINI